MNPEMCVFEIESAYEDDVPCYVVARNLREALTKYRVVVAEYINQDYEAEGVDRRATPGDIEDPLSINQIAGPGQLIL